MVLQSFTKQTERVDKRCAVTVCVSSLDMSHTRRKIPAANATKRPQGDKSSECTFCLKDTCAVMAHVPPKFLVKSMLRVVCAAGVASVAAVVADVADVAVVDGVVDVAGAVETVAPSTCLLTAASVFCPDRPDAAKCKFSSVVLGATSAIGDDQALPCEVAVVVVVVVHGVLEDVAVAVLLVNEVEEVEESAELAVLIRSAECCFCCCCCCCFDFCCCCRDCCCCCFGCCFGCCCRCGGSAGTC
jgi:hypothetical protein